MENKTMILSPKINWAVTLFLSIYDLLLMIALPTALADAIVCPVDLVFLFGALIMLIFWLIVSDIILWQFRSKEILIFNDGILTAKQRGRIFNRKRQIEIKRVTNIILEKPQTYLIVFAIPVIFSRKDTKDIIVRYKDKKGRKREARIGQRILLKDALNIEQQIINYQSAK